MTSPFTLPSDIVDQGRREREDSALSSWASSTDKLVNEGMGAIKRVAGGVAEQLSPFAQALSEGGLTVPSLDDLTTPTNDAATRMQQEYERARQSVSTALGQSSPSIATTTTPSPITATGTASVAPNGVMPTGSSSVASAGTRASRFANEIAQVSREEGVPEDVLAGILDTENSDEQSVSPAGARGLMQVVPGQGFDLEGEDATDPLTSIRQGARALKEKYRMTGSWEGAGRAYFGYGTDAGGMDTDTYGSRYDANRAKYGQTANNSPDPASVPRIPPPQGGSLDIGDVAQRYAGGTYTFGGGRDYQGGIPGARDTDCSGFVSSVWRENGVDLPAHTDAAYAKLRQVGARQVSEQEAQPGDVVFYMGGGYGGNVTYHMGIYAGPGQILDASQWNGDTGVKLRPITHAGGPDDIVILRDPRVNGRPDPRVSAAPPPIKPSGIAESPLGERLTQTAGPPPADSPSDAPAGASQPAGATSLKAMSGDPQPMPEDASNAARDQETADLMRRLEDERQPSFSPQRNVVPYVDPNTNRNQAVPGRAVEWRGEPNAIPPINEDDPAGVTAAQYRAPLADTQTPVRDSWANDPQQPAPEYDPRDADQGAHEAYTGSAPADAAVAGAPNSNADVSGVPSAPAPIQATGSVEQQPQSAPLYGPSEAEAPQSPFKPLYDATGQVVGYVQGAADQIGQNMAGNRQAVEDANAASGTDQNPLTSAVQTVGNTVGSLVQPAGGGGEMTGRIAEIHRQAAEELGRNPIDQRATDDPGWRARHPQDAQELDDLESQLGLVVSGQAGDTPKTGATGPDSAMVPNLVERARGALSENASRVAAADARAAEQGGVQMLGSGFVPDRPRGPKTVEAIQSDIETARTWGQAAAERGDQELVDIARERISRLQGELVDAQNARRGLEPQIRSEVGRKVDEVALDPITAQDDVQRIRAQERVRASPADLSGPVSIPTNTGASRLNSGVGLGRSDLANAAQGAFLGATSEDLQAQQEGRDADPNERMRRAVGGGLLAVAGGRFGRRGVGPAARELGSGVVPESLNTPRVQNAISAAERRAQNMERRGIETPSVWDWIKQAGYAGIYGPATLTNAVVGGAQELLMGQPKELVRALVSGRPGNYGAQVRSQIRAMPEGLAGLGRILFGADSAEAIAARSGGSQGTANLSERVANPVGHFAARVLERPGEILTEAPDAIFRPLFTAQGMQREAGKIAAERGLRGSRASSYADELMQAAEELRKNPDTPVASEDARRIVDAGSAYADQLGYKGKPGAFGQKLGEWSKRDDLIGVLASFLVPFPSMAARMTESAARSTPGIGLLPSVRRGQATKFDVVYDQALGTAVAAGLAYWAFNGGITGSGPADPEKRKMMIDQGWQPNSTLVGNYYVPNRVFGRFQPMLDTAGEIHDALTYGKKDAKPGELASDLVKRGTKIATDQTGLSGLADLHDMLTQGFASQFPGWVARSGARYFPYAGVIRAAATATDDKQRKPEGWSDVGLNEAIRQNAKMAIPGLRQDVPAAQRMLGDEAPNPQQGLGALIPRVTTQKDDSFIQAFQAAGVDIGMPPSKISDVPITPAQQRRYQQVMGRELQRIAGPVVNGPNWQSMPPNVRKQLLETFQSTARTLAETAVSSEGGADFAQQRAKATVDKAMGR